MVTAVCTPVKGKQLEPRLKLLHPISQQNLEADEIRLGRILVNRQSVSSTQRRDSVTGAIVVATHVPELTIEITVSRFYLNLRRETKVAKLPTGVGRPGCNGSGRAGCTRGGEGTAVR
jgi:hypothetical protein